MTTLDSTPPAVSNTRPTAPLSDDGQLFRLLVQGVTDYAIYMLDPDGIICNWNAGGRRIKGYEESEVIGQHFSRFYTEADRIAGLPAHALEVARLHGRYEKEGWRLRKDGSHFWACEVIDPIWQHDRLIGFAKITRDMTEQHEAELRLEEARRALAQAQKIEAVGKLTLGLSHDFNNLLSVIVNSLDLIVVHRQDAARTSALVEGALRAAERGSQLTRQLLAFARGQELAPEAHDLNALLLRSRELFLRSCGSTVCFEYELGQALPEVLIDGVQFEAAILNLLVNSRDAMPQGGRIVIVTEARRMAGPLPDAPLRNHVTVKVADTGAGMSEEALQRAVEPFFTTKDVGKGSGLGLSQVHGFAAQSGGFLQLESRPGVGTSVSICLPVAGE
ncbi:PAS domain S-box-containing protein [Luteimonas cucumeris]|uniref:histidine kinase n=1 Tax=Luteimonas cucumeris TaxID=985012 RepID=A0A562L230_9GAMM|nr:ATP-binding protein [Luteimonas cucumeris]TWI01720.1 PAS domain S-box-containing protein [Luteimonas cucumeris]